MALAHQALGEGDKAIAVLNEGLEKAPHVWVLWHLLGNLLSDKGEYVEAQHAYDMALACPTVNESWVNYNLAVLRGRQGRYEEALDACLNVTGDELRTAVRLLTASLLNSLRRYDEAIQLAEEIIAEISYQEDPSEEDLRSLGTAYAELSRGLYEGKDVRDLALETALKALTFNKSDWLALKMVRDIRDRRAEDSRWFKVVIEGRWYEPFEGQNELPGFFSSYELVAGSPEQCLDLIKEIEHEKVIDSLEVEQIETLDPAPGELLGVYWRSGYAFFSTGKKSVKRTGKSKRSGSGL
jgi:tetratricopeptide (TPR) repeat protein